MRNEELEVGATVSAASAVGDSQVRDMLGKENGLEVAEGRIDALSARELWCCGAESWAGEGKLASSAPSRGFKLGTCRSSRGS